MPTLIVGQETAKTVIPITDLRELEGCLQSFRDDTSNILRRIKDLHGVICGTEGDKAEKRDDTPCNGFLQRIEISVNDIASNISHIQYYLAKIESVCMPDEAVEKTKCLTKTP